LLEVQTTLEAIGSIHRNVSRYSKNIKRSFLKFLKPFKNVEAKIAEMAQQSTN
jgi:hypothetical protein